MSISVSKTSKPAVKPANDTLAFGRYFSDHMFMLNYTSDKGWHQARVVPYQPISLDPGASVLHYGQALFEGMKAFYQTNGKYVLFRPEFNWTRLCQGAERLCMPCPPKELFLEGIRELVRTDQDWIPKERGCSLYIRPTLIGTEAFLGVRPANEVLFFVILSPVKSYYAEGAAPVKIWIEEEYLRAAPGGLGATKAAANYANSLKAAQEAKNKGYSQVLWLDVHRQNIEEVGTMNVFFVFDNEIVTPALDGTILGGGVRDSVISLLKSWNQPLRERKVSLQEILHAADSGKLKEVFGTGTAAVISPVGELSSKKHKIIVNNHQIGPLSKKLYEELNAILYGDKSDNFGWIQPL